MTGLKVKLTGRISDMDNALLQYIELYDTQARALDAGSAGVINAHRHAAKMALVGRRLPRKGEEDYEKISIEEMFAPDYGVNVNRVDLPCDVAAAFKCGVPNVSTLLAILVGDRFVATPTLVANMPKGVKVMSLAQAAREYPAEVEKYYATVAPVDSVGASLNTMLVQDGVYIHVDAGVQVDRPIQVVTLNASPVPMLTPRRVLVVGERDARFSVLMCDHSMRSDVDTLTSEVVEVVAGQGAHIDICSIEETHTANHRYSLTYVTQQEGSNVSLGGMTLHNGVTRNEYLVKIQGSRCECSLNGMAVGNGHSIIDNCSNILHLSGGSKSNQLFKYVLDDDSQGAFEGSIEVAPGARFTEAFQTDRNILASKDARMHSKPRLLIYNDDVKCSHGATTGQLDEKALFYMQSRGIPREEGRLMLMQAFLAEVVDHIRVESVRDRLRHLVDRRMAGHDAHCASCK